MKQEFYFYQTFLALTTRRPAFQSSLLYFSDFVTWIIESKGKTLENVKLLAPYVTSHVAKPQRLLYDCEDYYIAEDSSTATFYACFRDLVMVDVDFPSEDECNHYFKWIIDKCDAHPDWRLVIYRSRNGFHIFPLHTKMNEEEKALFQLELQGDFLYTVYTYIRQGSSIRLSPKDKEELPIYSLVGYLGNGKEIPELEALSELQANLAEMICRVVQK